MGNDITSKDAAEFRAFCHNATPSQLRNIFDKEKSAGREGYAQIARDVAAARGVDLS